MALASAVITKSERFAGSRYRLLNQIGAGGMGQVYRAHDRLTGEEVALKQIALAGWEQAAERSDLQLALAREFQALAALRHPHIISVRDFGFDNGGSPYFTMELLHTPTPMTLAGQWADDATRSRWLWQLLLALDYIHQAGIVHRDLKPGNVLVVDGSTRVVDFGLATLAGAPGAPAGTPGYVAPELLDGAPPDSLSDLYAVGILAYELFAGWHPFGETLAQLPARARTHELDFSYVALAEPMQAVIGRLAARAPADRFPSARAAIVALAEATDLPLPAETAHTRESFLVAAPFTGRQAELARLMARLEAARGGHGSAWLVAGESGIGKSRLLAELRTRALIGGVVAAAGEAQESGSTPYRLFYDVVRRLVLVAPPDARTAAVLTAIVPDLAGLLQQPLVALPPLPPEAAQARLHTSVLSLLTDAAQQRPLLILLEDVHWADAGSLALIDYLSRQVTPLPILLLATYRPGERHDLAALLPGLQQLVLQRLDRSQIVSLAGAMLADRQPGEALMALLERETEGNTFFLVEVLRALAEEAGQLGRVGALPLPAAVSAGGIARVIERRLGRVPEIYRPLLISAAVAGRRVDLRLLQVLHPAADLDAWLTVCANGGVLNQPDDRLYWQFSHDKLRGGLLAMLTAPQQRAEHSRIGRALETAYADDLAPYYAALAYHFDAAEQRASAIDYLRLAAVAAQNAYAHESVLLHYGRLHTLVEDARERAEVALQLARTLRALGRLDEARAHAEAVLTAADTLNSRRLRAEALLESGRVLRVRAVYGEALAALQEAAEHYRAAGDLVRRCETVADIANVYYQQGMYNEARAILTDALPDATLAGSAAQALILHNLGSVAYAQSAFDEAEQLGHQALALRRQIEDRVEIGNSLNNLGLVAFRRKHYDEAIALLEESLAVRRDVDDRLGMAASLNNLGMIPYQRRDYAAARRYWEECVAVRRAVGAHWQLLHGLDNLALVTVALGDYDEAATVLREVIAERRKINDRQGLLITLGNRGRLALRMDEARPAFDLYYESTVLAVEVGDQLGIVFGVAGMAAALAGDAAQRVQALQLLSAAEAIRVQVNAAWETDEQQLFEATRALLVQSLPADVAAAAWRAGHALDVAAALTLAAQTAQREREQ